MDPEPDQKCLADELKGMLLRLGMPIDYLTVLVQDDKSRIELNFSEPVFSRDTSLRDASPVKRLTIRMPVSMKCEELYRQTIAALYRSKLYSF
jgi:hypothetical protein